MLSDSFFKQAIDSQSVAVFVIDLDHRVIFWNKACEVLTGISSAEMVGSREVWRAFYREQRPTMADLLIAGQTDKADRLYTVQGDSPLSAGARHGEGWFSNLGGKTRYVILDAAPIFDDVGKLWAAVETLQDITEHKLLERRLQQREADLKQAQAIARLGNWRYDFATGRMECSDETYRILGLPLGSTIDEGSFARFLRPDQLRNRQAAWASALSGLPYEIELHIVSDGRELWANERVEIVRNEDGTPKSALGTLQDVTERHETLKLLNLRQTQYQAVVDAAADGFWMTDLEGRIVDVNDAYLRRSGYSRDEMLAMHAWDLDADKDRDGIVADVLRVFEEGRGTFATRHRAKDGTIWPVSLSLSYWPTGEGRIFVFFNAEKGTKQPGAQQPPPDEAE